MHAPHQLRLVAVLRVVMAESARSCNATTDESATPCNASTSIGVSWSSWSPHGQASHITIAPRVECAPHGASGTSACAVSKGAIAKMCVVLLTYIHTRKTLAWGSRKRWVVALCDRVTRSPRTATSAVRLVLLTYIHTYCFEYNEYVFPMLSPCRLTTQAKRALILGQRPDAQP